MKLTHHNGVIEKIGYFFFGHANEGYVHVQFKNSGGTCAFDLVDRKVISNFVELFRDFEIDIENGFYLEALKGKPLVGWFDENERIQGVSSFTDDIGNNIVSLH